MKKIMVAMSGGVDSSVTAYLLKEEGYTIAGGTMALLPSEGFPCKKNNAQKSEPMTSEKDEQGRACGTTSDLKDAATVAKSLGIPHETFSMVDDFSYRVIMPFISAYQEGKTPNPCILCNQYMKFDRLLLSALSLGYDGIATGHYARIRKREDGTHVLMRAKDPKKDQSYFLYRLTENELSRTLFPLGELTKDEVREKAKEAGFAVAEKKDSQDICFIKNTTYSAFMEHMTGRVMPKGNFVDRAGNILGEHKGIDKYTVGQHKGIGISHIEGLYVLAIRPNENEVLLGKSEELFADEVTLVDCVLLPEYRGKTFEATAKIRSGATPVPVRVIHHLPNQMTVFFHTPQRAPTKGQALVLYDGDIVLGGGEISSTLG